MESHEEYLHKLPAGSKDELREYAYEVIRNFYTDFGVDYSHHYLWQFFRLSFCSNKSGIKGVQKQTILSFYERLHELLTAGDIINNDIRACPNRT